MVKTSEGQTCFLLSHVHFSFPANKVFRVERGRKMREAREGTEAVFFLGRVVGLGTEKNAPVGPLIYPK